MLLELLAQGLLSVCHRRGMCLVLIHVLLRVRVFEAELPYAPRLTAVEEAACHSGVRLGPTLLPV